MAQNGQTEQNVEQQSEQDLSEGKLENQEPLERIQDPPSRLAGYNQARHLEHDSQNANNDEQMKSAFADGGNQTAVVDRQNQLEQQSSAPQENEKTAN